MLKKLIAGIAAATAVFTVQCAVMAAQSGECGAEGSNVVWTLENGTVTISGSGAMADYSAVEEPDKGPWLLCGEEVRNAVIQDGVTNVGRRAFYGCETLESVVLADSVTSIGGAAFYYCGDSFTSITIPAGVNSIEQSALNGNSNLVIKGYDGTYAQDFASENGISFESLGAAEREQITVSNPDELLAAIGSNRDIILNNGIYVFDSMIDLNGISDITIKAAEAGKAEILSKDGYNPVVRMLGVRNAELDGLILGHESIRYEDGCGSGQNSSGYVVQANNSDTVKINNCDLYGCGTVAVVLSYTDNFSAYGCVMRDCKESIASIAGENVYFENCIISGNAYDDEYAQTQAAITVIDYNSEFDNCLFINNNSTEFMNKIGNGSITDQTSEYFNNVWQDEVPEEYGVCLNGITWQITDGVLRLGYPVERDGEVIAESTTGSVLPYSMYSLPWRGKTYTEVDTAPGVFYENSMNGECGDNAKWSFSDGTLNISGTGSISAYSTLTPAPWSEFADEISSVVIEEGITEIGSYAFYNMPSITSLSLPESLEKIGLTAFSNCTGLKNITFPSGIKTIGSNAFSYCNGLTEIRLNEGVEKIDAAAFSSCSGLEKVYLPSTLKELGRRVFFRCDALNEITAVKGENFTSVNGMLMSADEKQLILCPYGYKTDVIVIPSGVETIGEDAFFENGSDRIIIPEGVRNIGDRAFAWFGGSSIIVPESVESVGTEAFSYISSADMLVYRDSFAHGYFETEGIKYSFLPKIGDVNIIEENDSVVVRADVSEIENAFVFCAGTSGGILTGVERINADGSAVLPGGTDSVKIFCWSSMEDMIPLCDVIEK